MADYHPLISRAVAGVDKNTAEARRAIYERARTALLTQLRGVTPQLSESDITRERLALEEAIRKVEAEAVRRARVDAANAPESALAEIPKRPAAPPSPPAAPPVKPPSPPRTAAPPPQQPSVPPPSLADEALREFRSGVEAAGVPGADASLAPASSGRVGDERPAPAPRPPTAEPATGGPPTAWADAMPAPQAEPVGAERPHAGIPDEPRSFRDYEEAIARESEDRAQAGDVYDSPPHDVPPDDEPPLPPARLRSYRGLITALVVLLVFGGIGGIGYWQYPRIQALLKRVPAASTPPAKETAPAPPARAKIEDRVEPSRPGQARQATPPAAAVAQRVVLYEEDPADPAGKRYVGSVIWRTETVSPGPGQPPELAVKADIEVPERRFGLTFSMRRNTDAALPASHTIEVMFRLPPDFSAGAVANVPGVLMKQSEQSRGVPLAGVGVKVTNGYYLIALYSVETERERNIKLIKERGWFDIPIVYTNGRRAILAMEKGIPGERAFADAFAAWGQ